MPLVNHSARKLFCSLLDEEWPDLKKSLIERVWPAYRSCWRTWEEWAEGDEPEDYARIRSNEGSDRESWSEEVEHGLIAPAAVSDLRKLSHSKPCIDLWKAFIAWADANAIRDEWMLQTALATLRRTLFSAPLAPDLQQVVWDYDCPFYDLWVPDLPILYGTGPAHASGNSKFPDPGEWESWERRARREFENTLRELRKQFVAPWAVSHPNASAHCRWTIARLSGLTWSQVVMRFPEIGRYSEAIPEAKRRVRMFAKIIRLTLARPSAANNKIKR
jgi:hypothetical protein